MIYALQIKRILFYRLAIFLAFLIVVPFCSALTDSDALLDKLVREKQPGFTYDFAGLITDGDRTAIDNALRDLEQKTTAQIKVVTLPSIEDGEIRDFANRLFQGWGIGQKGKDNGILILMAKEERKIQIEVGYGLEGVMPDAKTGRILDQYVIPYFKNGDYSSGLKEGSLAVAQVVAESYGVKLSAAPSAPRIISVQKKIGLRHILITIILIILFARHPWLLLFLLRSGVGGGGGGFGGGGFGGGGFGGGGFGGGSSGGGGAGRSW